MKLTPDTFLIISRRSVSVLFFSCLLLLKKSQHEVDVFDDNLSASQPLCQVLVKEAVGFIRTFSVHFLSVVRIIWFIIRSISSYVSSSKLFPFGTILVSLLSPPSVPTFPYKKQEEHFCSSCFCIVTFSAIFYSVCIYLSPLNGNLGLLL